MVPVRALAAWASAFLLVVAALGQNQLGDGRRLDANLQQGSGGYNSAQAVDGRINSGNAVVTGNVPGLQYFHGNVGYSAPGEFSGSLSGDSLFRFRAQSYGPVYDTAPNASAFGSGVAPVQIYRGGANPSVQGISPTGQMYGFRTFDPTGIQVFQPTSGLAGTPLGAAPVVGTPLGFVQSERGWVQVQASPLLGVRQQPLAAARVAATLQRGAVGAWVPVEAPDGTQLEVAPPAAVKAPATAQPTGALPIPQVPPSLIMGAQLQGRLDQEIQAQPQAIEQSVEDLRNKLLPQARTDQEDQEKETRGQTAYVNLLRQLRAAQSPRPPSGSPQQALRRQEEAMQGTPPQESEAEETQRLRSVPVPPGQEQPTMNLRQPSSEELAKAEQEREEAVRRASGLRGQTGAQDQRPSQTARPVPKELQQLLEKVNYRLPPIASMAGQAQGSLAEAYRTAEAALAKGQYFPAMEQYRQIQTRWPNEPMAVAGQVHAAMGAGMIRTAALSLRRLLEQHPELIAVRYEPRLLPTEERLQWVRDQLQEMATQGVSPDAGLVIAYLGYQTNSTSLVRYGLDLAQTASPEDPLLTLLRQIWLQGEAPAGERSGSASGSQPAGPVPRGQ